EHVDGRGLNDNDTLRLDYSGYGVDIGQGVIGGFSSDPDDAFDGQLTRLTASGTAILDTVNFESIEHLDIVGTRRADTIFGGRDYDTIVTGAGADTIYSGLGADIVLAGSGNDRVFYGNDDEHQGLGEEGGTTPFYLDGGRGIDTLSISLAQTSDNVTL